MQNHDPSASTSWKILQNLSQISWPWKNCSKLGEEAEKEEVHHVREPPVFHVGEGPIKDENRGRGDRDRIMMNNERRPWDDSEDDEDTEISRMSQTPSTSIFYLSSAMSLYTDSGPLAFPQAPHKIQLDSPASVLGYSTEILFFST